MLATPHHSAADLLEPVSLSAVRPLRLTAFHD